ncbi:MAG: hypothetical protein A2275_17610 [Bacteroidetes bacterium RIFOXYA12_FULL_35_11]|nr:MAG: hypothetical protein A2X01_07190 [Bacteroidetes bacterium GWF2_35_48]OFY79697.1 MAG: hypothetical protein A2275_17610 [Bacteroidetes bacterium RIFOXYA12_FULL_35_11]OFY92673.1 MAG: hypothetical protein A2491_09835 [Bacteroidetes bacterium RIFOXYC12_FULL_35_7]OFY95896.1 MAG: hypothetical protein A2309_08275 [Bacteroidetes bacterium RIFOXYB2_FULL_35_7]HBX53170.1 hypothetical protein [Bacteroidales bacterium]
MKFFALKFFVCLFLSLVLLHPVFSQENDFSAGFMAGGNGIDIRGKSYSFWRGTNNDTWGGLGISGGIFCERYLFKNFLAALQIRYIQKGSTYQFLNGFNETQREALRIQYIEVPVLVGYKFKPKEGKGYCIVQAGIAYAQSISSKYIFNELAENTKKQEMENFKNKDLSIVASLKVPLNEPGKNNFFLGLTADWSLISIHKYYDLHNLCYGLELSYFFFSTKRK